MDGICDGISDAISHTLAYDSPVPSPLAKPPTMFPSAFIPMASPILSYIAIPVNSVLLRSQSLTSKLYTCIKPLYVAFVLEFLPLIASLLPLLDSET